MRQMVIAATLAITGIGTAGAAVFDFSYTTLSGITAQGSISATDLGGFYSVDDVSGTRDGAAITDYDFFDPTAQSFNYSAGLASNVDFNFYVGTDNYEIRWPGNGSNFGNEYRTDGAGAVTSLLVTDFSLSPAAAAVPEPATWAMILVGFAGMGTMLRRSFRLSPSGQPPAGHGA